MKRVGDRLDCFELQAPSLQKEKKTRNKHAVIACVHNLSVVDCMHDSFRIIDAKLNSTRGNYYG